MFCSTRIPSKEESDANGRLIAAAPRLLAALEGVLQIWDDLYSNQSDEAERAAWEEARAALAEAKGG
jgi:hypothetical protein